MIYSILNEDPELLTALRTGVPLDLERIVFKMLAKDPAGRYQHADEVPVDLKSVKEMSSSIPRTKSVHAMSSETPSPAIWLRWLPWSLFLLMTIIAALALWGPWRSGLPERQNISRVVIPTSRLAESGHVITISPDDSRLVYVSIQDGESQLFLRELDQFTAIPIPDTEGAYSPFFSPDSQWIGFFSASKLKKVSLSGGKSTIICDAHYPYGGGTWGPDDVITIGYSGDLRRLPRLEENPRSSQTSTRELANIYMEGLNYYLVEKWYFIQFLTAPITHAILWLKIWRRMSSILLSREQAVFVIHPRDT